MSTTIERQPLKWHGGKSYLAKWIIGLMPPRVRNSNDPAADDDGWCHYVEPYFGGGAVLLALDPAGIGEVVNDRHGELTNFWRVLQSPKQFAALRRRLDATPCSQVEFERAAIAGGNAVERAARFFIRNRQSRQALGRDFATLARNRTRSGMNELPSAWLSAIEGLPAVHARLRRVVIVNDDAVKIIGRGDGPRTLYYCDPPYLHETRTTTDEYGQHEMQPADHERLLKMLLIVEGRFLLSGYPSQHYDSFARRCGWRCHKRKIDNKARGRRTKQQRTECVWTNY